jgi:hypothetical protein
VYLRRRIYYRLVAKKVRCGWLTFIARSRYAPLVMHKIQIWVDPGGIQGLTPTAKMGFGGAYQCRNLTSCARVGQALFGPVHPGKRSHAVSDALERHTVKNMPQALKLEAAHYFGSLEKAIAALKKQRKRLPGWNRRKIID